MHHEYHDGLCRHCGLPPKRADKAVCPVNKYGEPASRACEVLEMKCMGFDTRGMYALAQEPDNTNGFCERLPWRRVQIILDLVAKAEGAK